MCLSKNVKLIFILTFFCLRLFFIYVYHIFIGSVVQYMEQPLLACFAVSSLLAAYESIRPGLVQGCKAPNVVD